MKHHSQSIAIVGAIPAPHGGVSIHLMRILPYLDRNGIDYVLYDTGPSAVIRANVVKGGRAWWLVRKLFTFREDIIHFHNSRILMLLVAPLILSLRGKAVMWTFHDEFVMYWYNEANAILRWLFRRRIGALKHIICVNDRIKTWLEGIGFASEKISVIPAFIAPTEDEQNERNLSNEMKEFLAKHNPVISTHGWFGSWVEGVHVYSFDMIADLTAMLRTDYPNIGVYTVVSGTSDPAHRETILARRRELGIEDNWLILEKPFSAAALFARSDLFVRPSATDGDSVSIRECLAMGVPVVASDAVWRPPGCVLFTNRDIDSLYQTVKKVLGSLSEFRSKLKQHTSKDYGQMVMDVYKQLGAIQKRI